MELSMEILGSLEKGFCETNNKVKHKTIGDDTIEELYKLSWSAVKEQRRSRMYLLSWRTIWTCQWRIFGCGSMNRWFDRIGDHS